MYNETENSRHTSGRHWVDVGEHICVTSVHTHTLTYRYIVYVKTHVILQIVTGSTWESTYVSLVYTHTHTHTLSLSYIDT